MTPSTRTLRALRLLLSGTVVAGIAACAARHDESVHAPDSGVGARPALAADSVVGTSPSSEHAAHAGPLPGTPGDSAFAALQTRGASSAGMGVDQYTSTHRFDDADDGGRIELLRQGEDSAGVAQIRRHLRAIAVAFQAGDFTTPGFVHGMPATNVPGTSIMAARRGAITYTYRDLPRGGEVRIATRDTVAVRAVHAFLAFQRGDHRAHGDASRDSL
jgi:hypothetical protein